MDPDSQSPVWCNETTFKKSLKECETAISSDLGRSNLQNFLFIYLFIYFWNSGMCNIYLQSEPKTSQNTELEKLRFSRIYQFT